MNLADIEIFFSFTEEIDRFLHATGQLDIQEAVSLLEIASSTIRRKSVFSISHRIMVGAESNISHWKESISLVAKAILGQGAFAALLNTLWVITEDIEISNRDLILESELRAILNILYLLLTFSKECFSEESLALLERSIVALLKKPLISSGADTCCLPIKKLVILHYLYLEYTLSAFTEKCQVGFSFSSLQDSLRKPPKIAGPPSNPTEAFYVITI